MENNLNKLRNDLENKRIPTKYELSGGMMNKSYVFNFEGKDYVWYIPTKQANEMVDRKLEEKAQNIFYKLGITSKNLTFYEDGMKINEFIEGDSLNHIERFDVEKISKMLHKLHDSKLLIGVDYKPFEKVLSYQKEAANLGIKFDSNFHALLDFVMSKKEFLESQEKVLCHNDFQKSNIIRTPQDNYYVIDFEFAMDNDPYFDIAGFGNNNVEEGFDLLCKYCYNKITLNDVERYFNWRILLSLQWYLVALIKDERGEGAAHGYNFYDVATYFLSNASVAKNMLVTKRKELKI